MNVGYVEMIGGVAGNMLLGAFADCGLDLDDLEARLRTIPVSGWTLERKRVVKRGIAAQFIDFTIPGEDHAFDDAHAREHGRHLSEIIEIIERSALTPRQQERASAVYRALAVAEATIHGSSADHVHFHEVGHVDAILDVASTCVALDLLGIERLYCGAFPLGTGTIEMLHGRFPNPAPATIELLRDWPVRHVDREGEFVTPTGAAILTTLCDAGMPPAMTIDRIGYGAGTSEFTVPNVTRLVLGETAERDTTGSERDEIVVIEANVDDMSPQYVEPAMEQLFAAGARDAWITPITMKKGRPAFTLSAIAPPDRADACAAALLHHTSTIGVRMRRESRLMLSRSIRTVDTPYGAVRVKDSGTNGTRRTTIEYDDLVRLARETGLPVPELARRVQPLADRVEGPV